MGFGICGSPRQTDGPGPNPESQIPNTTQRKRDKMDIKADEISKIIREQIGSFAVDVDVAEVGSIISIGDGIAKAFAEPASIKQPRSQIANGSRYVVTTGSWAGRELAVAVDQGPRRLNVR